MLSMPAISNIQAKTTVVSEVKETEECSICAKGIIKDLICGYFKWGMNIAQRRATFFHFLKMEKLAAYWEAELAIWNLYHVGFGCP